MSETENPQFVPSPEFLARAKRMDDAINLRKPDRVPVAPLVVHYFASRSLGISNKDAQANLPLLYDCYRKAAIRYNWDVAAPTGPVFSPQPLHLLGTTQFRWPGHGLPEDMPFQWVEREYMLAEEYREMLADPNGFAIKKVWPRVSTTLAPFSALAEQVSHMNLTAMSNAYMMGGMLMGMLSTPGVLDALKALPLILEEVQKGNQEAAEYSMGMAQLGFPTMFTTIALMPYDWISDNLRGLRGIMLDMYRHPEELLEAIEMITPITIQTAIMLAKITGVRGVFIPLHRGAGGFMSNKQFEKFYWPSLKALILALIDEDLLPIPLWEGDYSPRLEYLQDLPPKKWVGHFDIVDRKKVKALLGDRTAFWGNVPASMMCTGTPEQVIADVRELIEIFGDNGGLIIDSTMGIPDESRPENVQALTDAVEKYGVY